MSVTDTTEVAAECEAAFDIDLLQSEALRKAVAIFGRKPMYLIWQRGWCTGKSAGLDHARRVFEERQ